ncbi:MAG: DUF2868 domain-containing protein [Verrucomicrobiales bacterium]
MNQDDIRKILALQAVEEADEAEEILSPSDRREAAKIAGAPLGKQSDRKEQNRFLAARAEVLLTRVASRFPEAGKWVHQFSSRHRFGVLALTLSLVAAIVGFLTNELGPDKRINILSFPLLGIILWSFAVYVREIFLFSRTRDRLFRGGWIDSLTGFVQPEAARSEALRDGDDAEPSGKVLAGARGIFERRWRGLTAPVLGARLKSMLHLVAFILAAAAIFGLYLKGLANEYRAVWESTFFTDSEQLRPFLQLVLGPAAALTGDTVPTAEELSRIHWREGSGIAGENAARWIHWYAITVGLYVLLPRAAFAIAWRLRAARMARTLPFREVAPHYFDRIIATSSGSSLEISVIPYSVQLDDASKRAAATRLEDEFKRPVDITWTATVPFGEEETFAQPEAAEGRETIPLFDFASTPERETHLALYRTLSARTPHPVGFVLLETSAFDRKASSFADAKERRAARAEAWEKLFEAENVKLLPTSETTPVP